MSQETIERRFEAGSPARLKLGNIRGTIDIQAGESGFITVTAVKHLNSGNQDLTEIKIEQDDSGKVIVKTEYKNSVTNWFGLNKPCKVDYTVQVPQDCDMWINGVSCNIAVQGIQGEIHINSVSGNLDLNNLSGSLQAKSVSGTIKGTKVNGIAETNSVSGSIRVTESQIHQATFTTVSGNLTLETSLADGPYTFKSVSGSATMVVPANTACSTRFHSVSGRMKTSLPITKDSRQGPRGEMEILGGGPEISHHCVSGSLRIVTNETETAIEKPSTTPTPAQPRDQMAILQKIQGGQISVEEALKELNE